MIEYRSHSRDAVHSTGLSPVQYQSGEKCITATITKVGDRRVSNGHYGEPARWSMELA
jgi:transposase